MKTSQQAETSIRDGKISTKSLIYLTFPAALSAMLNNAYRVIDQYAVQWLGVDAQAAIASCTFVLIAFLRAIRYFLPVRLRWLPVRWVAVMSKSNSGLSAAR